MRTLLAALLVSLSVQAKDTVRIAFVEKFVCAPAPFQSPRTGFGYRVALMPKSSATRYNSHRATQS